MLGRLRCAGLVEFGGLAAAESNKPFQLLEKKVKELFPELTYSHIKRWMGHRPSTSDSLPVIGVSPNAPNVWLAYGHQHIGLTAGPKTGKIISEMILSKQSNLDTEPFSATRSGIVC
jgi:D-amino-acid dehydrogenase